MIPTPAGKDLLLGTPEEANSMIGDCEGGRLRAQSAVTELYQLAALLIGDERQAEALVETALAQTEVDPCADAEASIGAAQVALVAAAVAHFRQVDPSALEAPIAEASMGGCIESDDFSDASLVFEPKILREGLNKLLPTERLIFVVRAILGRDSTASAALLERAGCRGWGAAQVSDVFRRALCSVSTSLVHSAEARS